MKKIEIVEKTYNSGKTTYSFYIIRKLLWGLIKYKEPVKFLSPVIREHIVKYRKRELVIYRSKEECTRLAVDLEIDKETAENIRKWLESIDRHCKIGITGGKRIYYLYFFEKIINGYGNTRCLYLGESSYKDILIPIWRKYIRDVNTVTVKRY